ncbi:hypothetical protein Poli38472_006897 [Pythium oligandrum]|uniref:Uncharacterized protein n=1 Tax=Pythium oligandrum TaxID=41045 RepID=A0A8K1CA75_PYTOL|nr:hypothetical protein Poli38472_006897 [Pythium oligandrum]|eukprot:TMW58752.1 hypothetical protein Poli38472_006897 [Pythium oligandrum]
MTDRKRRKLADALGRFTTSAEELRALSLALTSAVSEHSKREVATLRIYPATSSSSAATTQAPKTATSLVSLVPITQLRDASDLDKAKEGDNWKIKAAQLARSLADSDPDAVDRCSRLIRRYESLAGTVSVYEGRLKQQSNEVTLTEKVEHQLEREEKAWESQMQEREHRVAELEVELSALKRSTEEEDDDEDIQQEVASTDPSESVTAENHSLQEALALRMEEKRDIEAALQSLRRKKRRRSMAENTVTETETALLSELDALREEKEQLRQGILKMEEEQERIEAEQRDVAALKTTMVERKAERQRVQEQLDKQKLLLSRMKSKMKHMVDIQLLTARDTSPPTLKEEAVILHLLYEHAGEMGVNELKQAATEFLAQFGKVNASGVVIRALYSLVANGVVQIDRTYGSGHVTSLLV